MRVLICLALGALTAAVGLLAVENRSEATVRWFGQSLTGSLAALIAAVFVAGMVAGWLALALARRLLRDAV